MSTPPSATTKSLLFADVEGYSALLDAELAYYVSVTLTEVVTRIGEPEAANTWGDGIFLVYEVPHDCALAALELRDYFRDTDWVQQGFPEKLRIRIALSHARVFIAHDPIRGAPAIFGRQVSRTARLEPVCAPNEVFCLDAMRVLLTDSDVLVTDRIGVRALAKGWGQELVYRLRRDYEAEWPCEDQPDITPEPLVGRRLRGYFGNAVITAADPDSGVAEIELSDGRHLRIAWSKALEWLIPESD